MLVDGFLKALEACNNKECLESVLREITAYYKLDHFIYGAIIHVAGGENVQIMLDGYPVKWWEHYISNNYFNQDAVVQKAATSLLPFLWSDLELNDVQQQIMDEAMPHGIVSGISLPIHTRTESASLSFASKEWNHPHLSTFKAELFLIAHGVHDAVIKQYRAENKILSDKQIEVLKLANDGLNNVEISEKLGISVDTVKYHMKVIYKKLEVKTFAEAISKAKALDLIPVI